MYQRLKSSKIVLASIGLFFTFMMTMTGISQTFSSHNSDFALNLGLTIAFLVLTVLLVKYLYKNITANRSTKLYTTYILSHRKVALQDLARICKKDISVVTQEVGKLIEDKVLDGYIDKDGFVVLSNYTEPAEPEKKEKIEYYELVKCSHCGATNKVVLGKQNRCEYCDSLLPMPQSSKY